MKSFLLMLLTLLPFSIQANMLNENLRQFFFQSPFSEYYGQLTSEESDALLIKQLEVAEECLDDHGFCEHALYSMRMTAELEHREHQTLQTQITLEYLDFAYQQLTSSGESFTALTIPLAFVDSRLALLRQAQYKNTLQVNGQFTPIDFAGIDRILLQKIEDNQDLSHLDNEHGESLEFNNPLSYAYKQLLLRVLKSNIEHELSEGTSTMLELFQQLFKDIVNTQPDRSVCDNCTARFIVEHYNDENDEKWYSEVNAIDYTAYGIDNILEFPHHRLIFPARYNSKAISFLLKFRVFYHDNEDIFDVDMYALGDLEPSDRNVLLQELGARVYHKAITPNLRRLFNTTVKVLTTVNQIDQLSDSVVAMRGIVSDKFKVANYSKTFALKTAFTSVLSKIPKVLLGEIQRHGCNADVWAPPQPFYILLEDLCVFTPVFSRKSFPITVSTTYGEQDKYPYEVAIFHKPTNQTLFKKRVSKGEQISLKQSSIMSFDLKEMLLYITNTNPNSYGDIAIIELSEEMFDAQYGGVIKKNQFHYVRKLDERKFNVHRGEKFGCPLLNMTKQEQKDCLLDRLDLYRKLPDYFYQNMEQVAAVAPMYPTSLMAILRQQEEEKQRIRAQALENAMAGIGWGPGTGGYGL